MPPQGSALSTRDVLVVLHAAAGRDLDAESRRLRRSLALHYEPVLGEVEVTTRVLTACRAVAAAVTAPGRAPRELPWVWGSAIGAAGRVTEEEVAAVLARPASAAELLGSFVVLGARADGGLRLVTGPDLVHTLSRCVGPAGQAWATKSWAGAIAAERQLRVAQDRIPELVLFDQVWGDDELLEGPALCEEASVIDLRAAGAQERSWWPVAERFAPGPPSSGAEVRRVLTDELRRVAQVPELALALTAGQDSTLVAVCLREAGGSARAYTFGGPGSPDHDGAAATARALGFSHVGVSTARAEPRTLQDAVVATAWTEGLDTAWNLVGPPLAWPTSLGSLHLSGSGGEMGRAFYYGDGPAPATTDDVLARLTRPGEHLPATARECLRQRLSSVVRPAMALTGDAPRALDLLYARHRMRSWLNRALPPPGAVGVHAAFTSPGVVSALADLPVQDRISGAGFAAALGADGQALRDDACRAAAPGRGSRLSRALRRRSGERPDAVGPQLLAHTASQLPDGLEVVGSVLGRSWWDDTLAVAPRHGWARRQLWNAIAVEALALRT